jgi:hydroxypyruvate reductase
MALTALQEMMKVNDEHSSSITFLSAGTDGTDGPTNAAGAVVDKETISIAIQKELKPDEYLKNNDAYNFFLQTNSLLKTGPTQTNVMDIVVALINANQGLVS